MALPHGRHGGHARYRLPDWLALLRVFRMHARFHRVDYDMEGQAAKTLHPGSETAATRPRANRGVAKALPRLEHGHWRDALDLMHRANLFWHAAGIASLIALTALMLVFREQLGILNVLLLYLLLTFFLALNGGL